MVRIRLFCTAGMSTSMLVSKMRKTARDKGIDVEISCYPVTSLQSQIDDADVVLLGPQIIFQLDKIKKVCDPLNIPVLLIDMVDYGMLNGEKVLNEAINLLKKEKN